MFSKYLYLKLLYKESQVRIVEKELYPDID